MTEHEARGILDSIRTAASFFEQGRRPFVLCGRSRYEVTRAGLVVTFEAVGRSGLRWKLSTAPFTPAVEHYNRRVRELGAEVLALGLEVKPGSQKAGAAVALLLTAALSAASCGAARVPSCRRVVTTWTDYTEAGEVIGARPVTLTVCDR